EKNIDVLVWGATGFTGGFVCDYLAARKQPEGFKWGIAGRSADKLSELKKRLEKDAKEKHGYDLVVEAVVADSSSQESVDAAVGRAKVVASCAGPFTRLGTPVVDACVRLGTDYCDITGETNWVRSLIEKYDSLADQNGVIIVPMCGFDCVPSDLTAFAVADHFRTKHNAKTAKVTALFTELIATPSGGTLLSACELLDQPPEVLKTIQDPYALNVSAGGAVDKSFVRHAVPAPFGWIAELGFYKAPSLTAGGNSPPVRRSVYLTKAFGDFLYEEAAGVTSIFGVVRTTIGLAITGIMIGTSFIRNLLRNVFTPAGQGPSEEERAKSRFHITALGVSEPLPDGTVKKCRVDFDGPSDPFYSGETNKYVAEAALSLALPARRSRLPLFARPEDFNGRRGGLLTPATAFGGVLVEALRQNGTGIDVQDL
ncbi:Saccharopine dehydrogenase-domain-containing protein, partial [Hyaloraphidium curvatum]